MPSLTSRGARWAGVWLAALAMIAALGFARATETKTAYLEVKMGLESISKEQRADLWRRVDEYATVDALLEFCGRKLNLQKRTWAAVSPCVEVASLRKVAATFRAKKAEYVKAWETAFAEPEKKKTLCDSQKPKMAEYTRILDAHIAEARSMCDACIFC